jgi:type IV secretory pathway VirB3-like protein
LLTVLSGENLSFDHAIIQYWQTLVIASLYSDQEATSLNSQFPALLIHVKFVAVANLSNIFATCARVIVWYGINASVVLYEVIHISYIQLIASMNSGEFVNVSFHAIISRLTLFQDAAFQVATVIQFESGLEVST